MFLFMPTVELRTSRPAAGAGTGGVNVTGVTGVFVEGAPPGAGVR